MKISPAYLAVSILLLIWLVSGWSALIQLSGGRARRIEAKNRELSRKMEEWIDNKQCYETIFRFLVLIAVSCLALAVYHVIKTYTLSFPLEVRVVVFLSALVLCIILAEAVSLLIVKNYDIALLSFTMPLVRMLGHSLLYPVVLLSRILGGKSDEYSFGENGEGRATAEDEIMSLVEQDVEDSGNGTGSLEDDERRMIRGVFDLDDTAVREIMTPRVDVKGISTNSSTEEAIALIKESGHSRIPLYEDSIDNIRGVLYAKDLLGKEKVSGENLLQLARRPFFIPETKEVGDLLKEIQLRRNHFAVVIDEYGGTAGIATLEDIIEEIVGEIRDEFDHNEHDTPMHVAMPDGSYVFDARALISDVNLMLDTAIPDGEEVDTIGGYVCGELGHIPVPGEEVSTCGGEICIKVLKSDSKRILKVGISKKG
ncbi:MAG: HlyC/CorC family transporter [Victivallales bacterium]|nr:HlyC/CorC family transporter [Victivallales bacterium]